MKKIIIFLAMGFAIYCTVWAIIYIWIMGLNFRYYWDYFRAAWWNPGEIPGLIRFYSVFITLFILLIILLVFLFFRKYVRR